MANRHVFRFEALLRLRKRIEDEKKRVVASRLREIVSLERRQSLLRQQIDLQTQALREASQDQPVDVDEMKWSRHWLTRLRIGVLEAEAELAAHRAMLAQERLNLVDARRDHEVLERLRERQREAFLAEASKREQTENDEISVMRFSRAGQLGDEHDGA